MNSGIFSQMGLDRFLLICPSCCFVAAPDRYFACAESDAVFRRPCPAEKQIQVWQVFRCQVFRFGESQVTQRPGCSSFATSVNTLTTGSQATVALRSLAFIVEGAAGRSRASSLASLARGMRSST